LPLALGKNGIENRTNYNDDKARMANFSKTFFLIYLFIIYRKKLKPPNVDFWIINQVMSNELIARFFYLKKK
jgi:hypothetical protein